MVPPLSSHLTYRWYPRSRGVYAAVLRALSWAVGSSPLARGLRGGRQLLRPPRRIIPARAGFTPDGRTSTARRDGSSPLARGLPRGDPRGPGEHRIIPARAGFTAAGPPSGRRSRDHPRSRGVYAWNVIVAGAQIGSSPLARGLPLPLFVTPPLERIIPARAGFTTAGTVIARGFEDHPRSRGVYLGRKPYDGRNPGSSPLARGLHSTQNRPKAGRWIIPARAGFTPPQPCLFRHTQDHPRSRGVYAHR